MYDMNRRFRNKIYAGFLILIVAWSSIFPQIPADAAVGSDELAPVTSYYAIRNLYLQGYTNNSLTIGWYSEEDDLEFDIYRKTNLDTDYVKLDTVAGTSSYVAQTYTDTGFRRGLTFSYKITAFQVTETGRMELNSVTAAWKLAIQQGNLYTVTRKQTTKAVLTWSLLQGVDGYEIYKKAAGSSSYKLAKRVSGQTKNKYTISGIAKTKNTKFKIRGYVKYSGKYVVGTCSEPLVLEKVDTSKLAVKFRKLQKKYPDGKYWNHVGKSNYSSATVTSKPCHHGVDGLASTCNHYICPNNVLGYQCYGFAWKMSDLIYGKKAKIKKISSFKKCKAGDVIRYSGHSVIIVKKYKNYITVGECNYGNTCIIKWGRKIYPSELAGASYSRRYK